MRRPPVRRLAGVVQGSITTDGTAVQVTIANSGDTAELSFACTAGDRVSALFGGTIEAADVWIVLPDTTNAAHASWGFHSGVFIDVTPLNQTGTCLLRINPGTFTGTETVQLWSVPPDVSYAITPGGSPLTVTTTVPGQNASVTFTGAVGQRVSLRVDNVVTEAADITITRPDGQQQTSGSWGFHTGTYIDATTLQLAGTYTIYVNPGLQFTGSEQLTLYDVPPDASGTLVIGGHVPVLYDDNAGPERLLHLLRHGRASGERRHQQRRDRGRQHQHSPTRRVTAREWQLELPPPDLRQYDP